MVCVSMCVFSIGSGLTEAWSWQNNGLPNVHVWILRICDYIALRGQKDFADIIKSRF